MPSAEALCRECEVRMLVEWADQTLCPETTQLMFALPAFIILYMACVDTCLKHHPAPIALWHKGQPSHRVLVN